ncbi:MAG: class I SAM-dependent methyltransferase [Phycisphaerae bacterium]
MDPIILPIRTWNNEDKPVHFRPVADIADLSYDDGAITYSLADDTHTYLASDKGRRFAKPPSTNVFQLQSNTIYALRGEAVCEGTPCAIRLIEYDNAQQLGQVTRALSSGPFEIIWKTDARHVFLRVAFRLSGNGQLTLRNLELKPCGTNVLHGCKEDQSSDRIRNTTPSETKQLQELHKLAAQIDLLKAGFTHFARLALPSLTLIDDIHNHLIDLPRHCPVCDKDVRAFLPSGRHPRLNARCPHCGSLERHRLLALFFRQKSSLFHGRLSLLHIAPEKCLVPFFKNNPNIEYISADLNDPQADIQMDIQNIELDDNTFDAIVCYHVLEHVPDDKKAMRELYRVLKPGGWAIIQSPVKWDSESTLEDQSATTSAERFRLYGHPGHLRHYGSDYAERLRSAGFRVSADKLTKRLDAGTMKRCGVKKSERIFFCRK